MAIADILLCIDPTTVYEGRLKLAVNLAQAHKAQRLCLDHIARFKRPRHYRFVGAIPFMALYHLTVPDSSTAARSAGGYIGRSGCARLGGSCCAVLLSTLKISLTCGPLGPGPARTSSVAPDGTLS